MNRKKTVYTVIIIAILLAVYGYEVFLNEKEKAQTVKTGETVKEHTKLYFMPSSTTGQVVHHHYYSLSYHEKHEQAEWVAYELKKSQLAKTNYKRPYFEIDQAVNTGAAHWRNYKNSGYDRGHLCPAGDRRFSKSAHDETFLTSNISPQEHEFNAGIWNRLEQKVRYWARKHDGLFVVTGGVLKNGMETIGHEGVAVPEYFYKVILDYNSGEPKMIGFLFPHKASNRPLREFEVPTDTIEKLTGINFFEQLDDSVEDYLESTLTYSKW